MNNSCTIAFPQTPYPDLTLALHENLSDHLTVQNSPVLFGCRTGICGTCLVLVAGDLPPPNPEERELLEVLAPHHPQARLACQIDPMGDLQIWAFRAIP